MNPDLLLQIQPSKKDFDAFQHQKTIENSHHGNDADKEARHTDKDSKSADQNKNFAAFMEHLRRNNANSAQTQPDKIPVFAVHEQAKPVENTTIQPDQALPANLNALNLEITKLLEEIRENADLPKDAQILNVATEQKATEADEEGIVALLSFLLNQIEPQSAEQDATSQQNTKADNPELSDLLGKLITLLGKNDEDLIVSGFSPQDLAILQKEIQALLKEETALQDQRQLNALQTKLVSINEKSENTPAQKAVEFSPEHVKSERYEMRYQNSGQSSAAETTESNTDFKSALKGTDGQNATGDGKTGQAPASQGTALPAWMALGGESFALATPDAGLSLQNTGVAAIPGQALQAGMTNIMTQAPAAGQPHPAIQIVTSTIQKALRAGQDTNIKLQLDPPELGRVEVKMSFGKDSPTKIVLTAEKPETFMMLQRDAHMLERALQDAGLDAGDSSLSFELAQQDHDFGGGNQRGGGHDPGGNGAGLEDQNQETIETTMTWHVDPDTGYTRYDIVA